MSNYTKAVDFAAKDALLAGNPAKLGKGTEVDTEFNNIATAIASKIDLNGAGGTPSSLTLTNATGLPATAAVNTPAGNIAATTVQAAINELDAEKAALAGSASQAFSVTVPTSAAHAVRADMAYVAQDFRLSLTTALPVTTGDVIGATTIYAVPKTGNKIGLYNGSIWTNYISSQFSLALGTLTSGKPYDVFCYQSAGVPTLEFLVWTNDSTRATTLSYDSGVLIKSGDTTRRYLGTFYTTSTTQTEDSVANRYLYNYYHRVEKPLYKTDTTASWTYTTFAFRQVNANAANQINFIIGVAEDSVKAFSNGYCTNASTAGIMTSGIGLDSTSLNSCSRETSGSTYGTSGPAISSAIYLGVPASGKHSLVWLERSTAIGTTTWYGQSNVPVGIEGAVQC